MPHPCRDGATSLGFCAQPQVGSSISSKPYQLGAFRLAGQLMPSQMPSPPLSPRCEHPELCKRRRPKTVQQSCEDAACAHTVPRPTPAMRASTAGSTLPGPWPSPAVAPTVAPLVLPSWGTCGHPRNGAVPSTFSPQHQENQCSLGLQQSQPPTQHPGLYTALAGTSPIPSQPCSFHDSPSKHRRCVQSGSHPPASTTAAEHPPGPAPGLLQH